MPDNEQKDKQTNINMGADPIALEILSSLFSMGYQEKSEGDFLVEVLGDENEAIKEIANQLNGQIRNISSDEIKRIASPITMKITSINSDGTINVNKPSENNNQEHCWTHIPNPTIFQHLDIGDEVLLGYYEGEQKSNCWVMFAKVSGSNIEQKSIYKDINELYKIADNTELLKGLLYKIIIDKYPDVESTGVDSEGNTYTYYTPHPTRVTFEEEMRQQWKEVKK